MSPTRCACVRACVCVFVCTAADKLYPAFVKLAEDAGCDDTTIRRMFCQNVKLAYRVGPIEVFDPHFHIWDIREPEGYADKTTLFAPAGTDHEGLYDAADLEKDLDALLAE